MIKKIAMAATVVLLVMLVLLTPRLTGRQEDISTLPRLIINLDEDDLVLYVTSFSGTYIYENISMSVTSFGNYSFSFSRHVVRNHSLEERVPIQSTKSFQLNITVYDKKGGVYEYSGMVTVETDARTRELILIIRSDPEDQPKTITQDDLENLAFTTFIPRRQER